MADTSEFMFDPTNTGRNTIVRAGNILTRINNALMPSKVRIAEERRPSREQTSRRPRPLPVREDWMISAAHTMLLRTGQETGGRFRPLLKRPKLAHEA